MVNEINADWDSKLCPSVLFSQEIVSNPSVLRFDKFLIVVKSLSHLAGMGNQSIYR